MLRKKLGLKEKKNYFMKKICVWTLFFFLALKIRDGWVTENQILFLLVLTYNIVNGTSKQFTTWPLKFNWKKKAKMLFAKQDQAEEEEDEQRYS